MIYLESDYNNGAHPEVLRHLAETNSKRTESYGYDEYSANASRLIKDAAECDDAQVYFLTGGTQTNKLVIGSTLRQTEGVVAVDSGHINIHEAGAIEMTGHKVVTLPHHMGKMDAGELETLMENFFADDTHPHCVAPAMVYITFPTEYGTLYSAKELTEIHDVCRKYDMPLFVDGARLGYALASPENDISLPFLARHCDMFYIGGTKVGALCGEAVVFTHHNAHPRIFSIIKQYGALLAKSRLTGVQFEALFTDNLYYRCGKHGIDMAMRLKEIFKNKGFRQYMDSPTNQQFFLMSEEEAERVRKDVMFEIWGKTDDSDYICRFVTSWATKEEDIERLSEIL